MYRHGSRWLRALAAAALVIQATGCGVFRPARRRETPPLPVTRAEHARLMEQAAERAAGLPPPKPLLYRGEAPEEQPPPVVSEGPADVTVYSSRLSPPAGGRLLVSVWVRCDELPTSGQDFAAVVGKYEPGNTSGSEWLLGIGSDGRPFAATTGGGAAARVTAGGAVSPGQYHHLCAEWSDGGDVRLYVDGRFAGSGTLAAPSQGVLPMVVGDAYPPDGDYALNGAVDELKIWHKAASDDFVQALYLAAPDTDGDGVSDGDDHDGNDDGVDDDWAFTYYGDRFADVPAGDADGDGMDNLDEATAGTNPFDEFSGFHVWTIETPPGMPGRLELEWDALSGRVYRVRSAPSLDRPATLWTSVVSTIESDTAGPLRTTLEVPAAERGFYRVTVSRE